MNKKIILPLALLLLLAGCLCSGLIWWFQPEYPGISPNGLPALYVRHQVYCGSSNSLALTGLSLARVHTYTLSASDSTIMREWFRLHRWDEEDILHSSVPVSIFRPRFPLNWNLRVMEFGVDKDVVLIPSPSGPVIMTSTAVSYICLIP